jgi:hypothetical protein
MHQVRTTDGASARATAIKAPPARPGLIVAPARLIENLTADAPSLTREALNDKFGISYNTWRKLMAGQPVRISLIERLTQRLGLVD